MSTPSSSHPGPGTAKPGRLTWSATRSLQVIAQALASSDWVEFVFDSAGGKVEKPPARDPLMDTGTNHVRQDLAVGGVVLTSLVLIAEQMSTEEQFLAALAGPTTEFTVVVPESAMGTGVVSQWGGRPPGVREPAGRPSATAGASVKAESPTYEVTVTWGPDPMVVVRPSLRTMMRIHQDRNGGQRMSQWNDALVARLHKTYIGEH